jgi:hypothetical protein
MLHTACKGCSQNLLTASLVSFPSISSGDVSAIIMISTSPASLAMSPSILLVVPIAGTVFSLEL